MLRCDGNEDGSAGEGWRHLEHFLTSYLTPCGDAWSLPWRSWTQGSVCRSPQVSAACPCRCVFTCQESVFHRFSWSKDGSIACIWLQAFSCCQNNTIPRIHAKPQMHIQRRFHSVVVRMEECFYHNNHFTLWLASYEHVDKYLTCLV